MKFTIYTFHTDTDHGNETHVFTSRAEHVAAILAEIEKSDPDMAAAMQAIHPETDRWEEHFYTWKETQSERQNYYASGEHEIELPFPYEWLETLESALVAVEYFHEREGMPRTLRNLRAIIAQANGKEAA